MKKIGIDAGGTLVKLVYEENGQLHFKTYSTSNMTKLADWVRMVAQNTRIFITGGKGAKLKRTFGQDAIQLEEFSTQVDGTNYLLKKSGKTIDDYILVNIGTGTSIFYVHADGYERLLGSGLGGGTLLGLGKLLSGSKEFSRLLELAEEGESQKSDLLVGDIYKDNDSPIVADLTAANFGKVHLQQTSEADQIASLIRMIGENILLLASQAAMMKNTNHIVFTGSTVAENLPLQRVITSFREMLSLDIIFPEKGSHAGALGAWLGGEA